MTPGRETEQTGGRESGSLSVFTVSGRNKEIWTNGDTVVDKEEGNSNRCV